jgi:hypothetical protein
MRASTETPVAAEITQRPPVEMTPELASFVDVCAPLQASFAGNALTVARNAIVVFVSDIIKKSGKH